jgi:hypothetical protein
MKPSSKGKKGRHETCCKLCNHPDRAKIEAEWIAWANTSRLAKENDISRDSIYRHCHALGLFEKRGRNIRAALERIIEQGDGVAVNAASLISAIAAYAKINSQGAWVDRVERIDLNALFDKMDVEELEAYAKDGTLPAWFTDVVPATLVNGQNGKLNG